MKVRIAMLALLVASLTAPLFAGQGPVPKGISNLDHVFLIVMENHGYAQIINNPNAPFINQLAKSTGYSSNYFAVGHPSLTNYLEIVGGSNFGVRSDDYPNWHSPSCMTNLATGAPALDSPAQVPALICPIWGNGTDAATPALDCTNEVSAPPCLWNIDGVKSLAAAPTVGKTIADQLVERGRSWKSYQESLPVGGADMVNYSDGYFTNNTSFASFINSSSFTQWKVQGVTIPAVMSQSDANGDIVLLYAAKHNPFAYFRSVQDGKDPRNSLANVVGFDGPAGLYQDLGTGDVPDLAFIVPNQCNDQHGRGNAGPFCNFDEDDNGTQTGLNQALILQGDVTVQKIVTSIKASPAWQRGNNAIVVVWDENDYTATPNQVVLIVDTNHGSQGIKSSQAYNHFSLLKTLESGFNLPCLNHACDSGVNVMSDLFQKDNDQDHDQDHGR
jgi:phosphatidylinositol-3-phosphatase